MRPEYAFIIKYLAGAILLASLLLPLFSCASPAADEPRTDAETGTEAPAETGETTAPETETEAPTESATEPETTVPVTTASEQSHAGTVLNGKKVIFIGNSMIYYGGVVTKGGYRGKDEGWFYQICRANGDDVTVIDCTYGNHHLYDFTGKCKTDGCDVGVGGDLLKGLDLSSFDYVFMSESGNNNSNFVQDVKNVMARFTGPETVFVYLCHTYSYDKGHTKVTGKLGELKELGVKIVDWGHLCYDLYSGRVKNPGANFRYVKNTFVNSVSGDSHHPNPLAGYIQAQAAYSAVTGVSAVGQSYDMRKTIKYGSGSVSYSAYLNKYYTSGDSNFADVFNSPEDMAGIQKLIDTYIEKWK